MESTKNYKIVKQVNGKARFEYCETLEEAKEIIEKVKEIASGLYAFQGWYNASKGQLLPHVKELGYWVSNGGNALVRTYVQEQNKETLV